MGFVIARGREGRYVTGVARLDWEHMVHVLGYRGVHGKRHHVRFDGKDGVGASTREGSNRQRR